MAAADNGGRPSAGGTGVATTPFRLKSAEFRREREQSWRELEELLEEIERRGLGSLTHGELSRLPVLHRMAASSLSVARAISLDRNVLDYLTNLTCRAHLAVYAGPRRPGRAVVEFLSARFPRIVRGFRRYLAWAFLCLGAGVVVGFLLTTRQPERYHSFVSAEMAGGRVPGAPTDSLRAVLYKGADTGGDALGLFATFLFGHNAKIGMMCLFLGFAAGIPVAFLLFTNGLSLGAMAALYSSRGLGLEFWAWILPHGGTELLAVALCGMAGFVFGSSIVFPGREARLANLARRGRRAGLAVVGAVALFFVAAVIEGVFRQLVRDVAIRSIVALIMAVGWALYFVRAGRGGKDELTDG
jgi:uncharacterized membrane protein SpoIIM required for sporulation